MTNLTENPVYETGVFRLETTTPVKGGEPVFVAGEPTDGFANAQAQQLANRTAYLKDQVDGVPQQIADSITQLKGEVDPFPQYPLETELGSAAFTSAANYATSAQGDKADTAVQPDELINYEKVLTAGANITIDRTDPNSPVISASASSGMTNPMTTAGDMVKAGVGGVAERLPIGIDGQVLTVSSGSPAWVDLSSSGGDVSGPASSVNSDVALFDGTTGKVIKSGGQLGTAAFTDSTAYATSSQGSLADTAVQPVDLVSIQNELDTKAPLESPTFTGNPTATTPSIGDNSTSIATTAHVRNSWYTGTDLQQTVASASGTLNIDPNSFSVFDLTLSSATTLTVTTPTIPTNGVRSFVVRIRQGTVAQTLTWWGGITWLASTTPAAPSANKVAEFVLSYSAAGWLGREGAKN